MPEQPKRAASSTWAIDEPTDGAVPAATCGPAVSGANATPPSLSTRSRSRSSRAPSHRPPKSPPSIFERLEAEWRRDCRLPYFDARAQFWAGLDPALAGRSPGQMVAGVSWSGYRPSAASSLVLTALLRQATHRVAARTLLQALLPRIRLERVLTPTYGHGVGENWSRPTDTVADLIAESFAAIKRHAGETSANVDRLIVGEAARRLRTARQAQRRYQSRTVTLEERSSGEKRASGRTVRELSAARTDAEWLAEAVIEAVRSGRLAGQDGRLLYATRVQGLPASEVGRQLGLPPGAVYYALHAAERALVASLTREPAA